MKKTLAVLLTLILTFSCFGILGTVSAVGNDGVVFELNMSEFTKWGYNNVSTQDTDGDGVRDAIRLDSTNGIPALYTPTFILSPGKEYKISLDIRVPNESKDFLTIPSGNTYKKTYPKFAIFQPGNTAAGELRQNGHLEGQNEYAYPYAQFGKVRRSSFSANWQVGNYGTQRVDGNSIFNTQFGNLLKDDSGDAVSPNVAFKGWTEISTTFTAIDDEANGAVGDQVVSILFRLDDNGKGSGVMYDIKNIKVIDVAAQSEEPTDPEPDPEPEEPEIPEESLRGPEFTESFEDYTANEVLFDAAKTEGTQEFYVYRDKKANVMEPNEKWANLSVASGSGYGHTGTKSLTGATFYQYAAMPLNLTPNTEYKLSFWYAYNNSLSDVYLNELTYGIYKPDNASQTMNVASGEGIFETKKVSAPTNALKGTWKKATLSFKTGANTDGLSFVYTYNDKSASNPEAAPNKTRLYIDDISVVYAENAPEKANITINSKDAASVEIVSGYIGDFNVGDKVQFKVRTKDSLTPTVTVNGSAVTPSSSGIYTITSAKENNVINVVCDGDENRRDAGKDKEGNDLTKYNEKIASIPVWQGNTVYHETAAFYSERGDEIKLLHPISEVISVRSYDLTVNYLEGIDYEITADGAIKRLEGSKIPMFAQSLTTKDPNNFPTNTSGEYVYTINDHTYPAYAINVTYEHTDVWEDGYTPTAVNSVAKDIPNVFKKLQNGEKVNIVIFGDSASCGWSTSGLNYVNGIYDGNGKLVNNALNIPPYTPTWIEMLKSNLEKLYPTATINVEILAFGGQTSSWGANNIITRLGYLEDKYGDWETDLMILGYAPNDLAAGLTNAQYADYMQQIISNLRTVTSDAEVLLWTHYIANTEVKQYALEGARGYRNELLSIAASNTGVGLVDTFTVFEEILKTKAVMDIFNDNLVHGNDFLTRVIAQCIISGLTTTGDVDRSGAAPDMDDVTALARYFAGWQVKDNFNLSAADMDGNGKFNLYDLVRLAQTVAGWFDEK